MNIEIGKKVLITTDCWFIAPDGRNYKAVHGTVKGVYSDQETLGIKTNRGSTNWYVEIGNMTIAGCQIHYAVTCDNVNFDRAEDATWGDGSYVEFNRLPAIYNADN